LADVGLDSTGTDTGFCHDCLGERLDRDQEGPSADVGLDSTGTDTGFCHDFLGERLDRDVVEPGAALTSFRESPGERCRRTSDLLR